ncbi:MAG: SDR family oxidoreductase [Planctomycetes bacterium]|nr:SDR family oxidoreductase [Planctomycetota bacterium]
MNISYDGKVVLVTGSAMGIGLAAAKGFAEAGASVAMADINVEALGKSVQALKDAGHKVLAIQCDTSNEDQIQAMVDKTVATYGRLDAAFNNAALQTPQVPMADMSNDDFDRTMAINLRGIFLCMRYEIKQMLTQGGGAIVNTSSQGGVTGFPGQAAYIASKHGVIGLTRTAALDYAKKNIRINAVCPGVILTPMVDRLIGGNREVEEQLEKMIPIGRLGEPREIADAVLWLCSPYASFVIGQPIIVDGGFTIP